MANKNFDLNMKAKPRKSIFSVDRDEMMEEKIPPKCKIDLYFFIHLGFCGTSLISRLIIKCQAEGRHLHSSQASDPSLSRL